ncbi:MAG TPA: peptide chain release factor N(5)-glutamine methyltransferase [Stellaceae bacterium]|nr:peptide chain release factor N(5)-glutamine methyltransferase [Stellaceae bacterium]
MSEPLLGGSVRAGEAVGAVAGRLAAAGVAESRREARLLVALALGVDPGVVLGYPERPLDATAQARLAALTARRAAREPYSRLAGRRQFWSLDLALSPDTLDPRPDSETLVEAALALLPDRSRRLRILDFGTGSGCLLLALLSELPNAVGLGIDLLPGAAITARRNAASLGLADRALFVAGDWGETISGRADVIVANPPYIPTAEIEALAPEVARYEPRPALDGGMDGLAAYRELAPVTRRLLAGDGIALFEVGAGQHEAVARLLCGSGLALQSVKCDLSGVARCVVVRRAWL